MSVLSCDHDFAPLGTDRVFCRHCGEFREAPSSHVCVPCLLPHGWPVYPVNPTPYRFWWTSTVATPQAPPYLVFNAASRGPDPDIDEHGNVV